MAATLRFAVDQRVETDAEHACDEFQLDAVLAVLAGTHVGGDRFRPSGCRPTVGIRQATQRRTEAFLGFPAGHVGGIGFAIHDQAEDPFAAAHALVGQHFLVDPTRHGRRGRTQHDQVFRLRERLIDLAAKIGGTREFLAIAEDRIQAARNFPIRCLRPDQPRWHAIRFERPVQPIRPRLVAVAVADEGAIGETRNRRLGHGRLRPRVILDGCDPREALGNRFRPVGRLCQSPEEM